MSKSRDALRDAAVRVFEAMPEEDPNKPLIRSCANNLVRELQKSTDQSVGVKTSLEIIAAIGQWLNQNYPLGTYPGEEVVREKLESVP